MMKNNFLDALIEQLEALKAENEQPNVSKVINLVLRTAADHKLSFDTKRSSLETMMALDGISPDEAELLRELDESNK